MLDPGGRRLLTAVIVVAGASSLAGVFTSLYLYVTGSGITSLALFNLGLYIGIAATSVWAAGQSYGLRPHVFFVLGVTLTAVFYALIAALGPRAGSLSLPLGLVSGVAQGVYWFSVNTLVYDLVTPRQRSHYYGTNLALSAVSGVLMPPVAGFLITALRHGLGYVVVFLVAAALYALAAWVASRLPPGHPVGGLRLRDTLTLSGTHPRWRTVEWATALRGSRDATGSFVTVALVYEITRSPSTLGLYTAAAAAAGVLAALLTRRLTPERSYVPAIWAGAAGLTGSALLLAVMAGLPPAATTVITALLFAYGVLSAVAVPFFQVPYSSVVLEVMDEDPRAEASRGSYILSREFAVNGGRIATIAVVFLLLAHLPLITVLVVALIGSGALQLWVAARMTYLRRTAPVRSLTALPPP